MLIAEQNIVAGVLCMGTFVALIAFVIWGSIHTAKQRAKEAEKSGRITGLSSSRGKIRFGSFLVIGAVVTSVARLSGIRPPRSDTGISHGGEIGYWIGTAIGISIGIVLIVKGLNASKDNRD